MKAAERSVLMPWLVLMCGCILYDVLMEFTKFRSFVLATPTIIMERAQPPTSNRTSDITIFVHSLGPFFGV
jgi:hypothetical protein